MSYQCSACQKGVVNSLPATCPVCGRYLTRPVSDQEAEQVRRAYLSASRAEQERMKESKQGFFSWLIEVGLDYIKEKLIDWAWEAIKRFFGF